jgi:hypothetical protein
LPELIAAPYVNHMVRKRDYCRRASDLRPTWVGSGGPIISYEDASVEPTELSNANDSNIDLTQLRTMTCNGRRALDLNLGSWLLMVVF